MICLYNKLQNRFTTLIDKKIDYGKEMPKKMPS